MRENPILFIVVLFAISCSEPDCISLIDEKDAAIQLSFEELRANPNDLLSYEEALQALLQREEALYAEVRACDFSTDRTKYDYWYRGRMKFPSSIQLELNRVERLLELRNDQ